MVTRLTQRFIYFQIGMLFRADFGNDSCIAMQDVPDGFRPNGVKILLFPQARHFLTRTLRIMTQPSAVSSPSSGLLGQLIAHLPVPCALFDQQGKLLVRSHRFELTFDEGALENEHVIHMLSDPDGDWRMICVETRSGQAKDCNAQAVRIANFILLSLDGDGNTELLAKIDELLEQNAELERLRSTDALTGVWNRGQFERAVALELDRSARFKQSLSLVLLDIDHFKRINDTYGHRVGDSVLKEMTRVTTGAIRLIDGLYRWGGEEFAVLAASTSYGNAGRLAEKLRSSIERHTFAEVGKVTVSIGVAEHQSPETLEDWFSRVDAALYRAKEGGRNQVCVDEGGDSDVWIATGDSPVIRLIWREAYESGHPLIDAEHRELIDLANVAFDASFGLEKDPSRLDAALERLLSHVEMHFTHEEKLLAEHGFKNFSSHQAAHRALLARARAIHADIEAGTSSTGALIEFLANKVVAQHLSGSDKEFFPLFAKAAVA